MALIDFKYVATWADEDGDSITYKFIVSGATSEEAYDSARVRVNWFERYYLTVGMKFTGMVLIGIDAKGVR